MSLHSRLRQQVKVRPYWGEGSNGPLWHPPTLEAARIESVNKLIRNADGDEVVASTTVYLGPDVDLPAGSRVMLPGDPDWDTELANADVVGSAVMQVAAVADGNGRNHHLEVSLQ